MDEQIVTLEDGTKARLIPLAKDVGAIKAPPPVGSFVAEGNEIIEIRVPTRQEAATGNFTPLKQVQAEPGVKPGLKTTEFWVAMVPQLAGIAALMGAFTPEQAGAVTQGAVQLAGIASMIASSFGYNISRGMAKKTGAK